MADNEIIDDEDSFAEESIARDEAEIDAQLQEMEETPPLHSKPDAGGSDDDADKQADDKQSKGDPQFVPLRKFHEANEQNKILRNRLDQLNAIVEQARRERQNQAPQQTVDQSSGDTPPEDPIEKLEWLERNYLRQQQEAKQRQEQSQAQSRQQEQYQRNEQQVEDLRQYAVNDMRQAAASDPVYDKLDEKLVAFKVAELESTLGMPKDVAVREAKMALLGEIHRGWESGRPPHLVMRALAESRGLIGKDAPQAQALNTQQDDRRDRHVSLSAVGGRSGRGAITAKDLASMDEDEFARVSDDVLKSLMGA